MCGLLQAEFEAGFERGGQTREHAQLAKTLGVAKLIVTVQHSQMSIVCCTRHAYWEVSHTAQLCARAFHPTFTCPSLSLTLNPIPLG